VGTEAQPSPFIASVGDTDSFQRNLKTISQLWIDEDSRKSSRPTLGPNIDEYGRQIPLTQTVNNSVVHSFNVMASRIRRHLRPQLRQPLPSHDLTALATIQQRWYTIVFLTALALALIALS